MRELGNDQNSTCKTFIRTLWSSHPVGTYVITNKSNWTPRIAWKSDNEFFDRLFHKPILVPSLFENIINMLHSSLPVFRRYFLHSSIHQFFNLRHSERLIVSPLTLIGPCQFNPIELAVIGWKSIYSIAQTFCTAIQFIFPKLWFLYVISFNTSIFHKLPSAWIIWAANQVRSIVHHNNRKSNHVLVSVELLSHTTP